MRQSEQINELAAALAKAQGEMEGASKDKQNPHFKSSYADLASVWAAIRGPLSKHGLSVIQLPFEDDKGRVSLETAILHASGQYISASYCLPPTKGDVQGYGSALTYMKRYALAGLGVAPEDDDGNAADRPAISSRPATSDDKISEDQRAGLASLLEMTGSNVEAFCRYFKINELPDLPASEYTRALQAIAKKTNGAAAHA